MNRLIGFQSNSRLRMAEFLPWILALLVFFVLPDYLSLGAQI